MRESTRIKFPSGSMKLTSQISYIQNLDDSSSAVITNETPFYPLNYKWPDQPSDTGLLHVSGVNLPVREAQVGALNSAETLFMEADIPVQPGEPGWTFHVVHIVDAVHELPTDIMGSQATFCVDESRRQAISASHTACHLMALALNATSAGFWTKSVVKDSLGCPDLDKLGIAESRIDTEGSVDTYRLGKSIRKKGFAANEFLGNLEQIAGLMREKIADWLAFGGNVSIECMGPFVHSQRVWIAQLSESTTARIPCGGTHVKSLAEITSVDIQLKLRTDEPGFISSSIVRRTT